MSSVPKKLLFAISDTGGGHRSAATAIIAAIEQNSSATCTIIDILRTTKFPGLTKAPEIYDYCSKNHLWLNNLFFRKTNDIKRINALTKMVYLQAHRHIEQELSTFQPDAVIAVHPLVIGLMKLARQRLQATWPIITVVTDLVTLHASWATPGADLYLTPTIEATEVLHKYGIPINRIVHTGFPIHPKYQQHNLTQNQAREALGLLPNTFTILLTGGGVGAGNMDEWVKTLEVQCSGKQVLVITGKNRGLFNKLKNKKLKGMYVYGFVDNMEVLMAASDIIVTKAGPGTIIEGIAMNRPLIITEAVGIQETGNIDLVIQNDLGYYCNDPILACKTINEVATQPHKNAMFTQNSIADLANGSTRIAEIIMQEANSYNQAVLAYNTIPGAS
ncbi:MAG: Monogalactosyldiacylglycerol synthase [Firmicutes bacterium]|nr:Monogalactosyldiacylglycerol synthase [Bacillota bacterium]